MQPVLLIDIGSTYTKVTAVDLEAARMLGTAKAFTTVEPDINIGLEQALADLHRLTGVSDFPVKYACSSAAGGLKMIAVGLVPDLTAEAARRAALSAGAKVLKTYAFELAPAEIMEISQFRPDIILLSGGTDGGNSKVILHNARALAAIGQPFTVVVAGNKSVAAQVSDILAVSGKLVRISENVMPEFNSLNIDPARAIIREVFLHQIIQAKGLTRVQELIDGILMPTPSAVLNAATLLAQGTASEPGLGDLLVVDVGGATTDVCSIADGRPTQANVIAKGLPEPFAKRTVEGDLGVRISAQALIDSVGFDLVREKSGLSGEQLQRCLDLVGDFPATLPGEFDGVANLDVGLARVAVKVATERHAGRIETVYSPFGAEYIQTGKDLTGVGHVIGTGGPVIYGQNPRQILAEALEKKASPILKPRSAELLLDQHYIMAAMGLLAESNPDIALRIMKNAMTRL